MSQSQAAEAQVQAKIRSESISSEELQSMRSFQFRQRVLHNKLITLKLIGTAKLIRNEGGCRPLYRYLLTGERFPSWAREFGFYLQSPAASTQAEHAHLWKYALDQIKLAYNELFDAWYIADELEPEDHEQEVYGFIKRVEKALKLWKKLEFKLEEDV